MSGLYISGSIQEFTRCGDIDFETNYMSRSGFGRRNYGSSSSSSTASASSFWRYGNRKEREGRGERGRECVRLWRRIDCSLYWSTVGMDGYIDGRTDRIDIPL